MSYYYRNLPHWHPEGAAIFLTWRLHGSYDKYRNGLEHGDLGRAFIEVDKVLDSAAFGPTWLAISEDWPWSSAGSKKFNNAKASANTGTNACATL